MAPSLDILGLISLGICAVALAQWSISRRVRYPPGPYFALLKVAAAREEAQELFTRWGRTYGDIIHIPVINRSMLVLNSLTAVRDLMEKRSGNYSCRPRLVLIAELMGWDTVLTNLPYGDQFRKQRRIVQDHFNSQAVVALRPLQRKETCTFLLGILNKPEAFEREIKRYFTAGSIMKIAYGHTVTSNDDLYVRLAEDATTATVASGGPGAMLVDFFPALRHIPTWMPGAGFKRHALQTRAKVERLMDRPFQMVKQSMVSGTAIPSFTSSLLVEYQSAGKCGMKEEGDIKSAAGVLYAAATDTTTAVLSAFFLAWTLYPEPFAKAQAELDSVIGSDRLPDFDDRPSLPFLDCIIKEMYRWSAPVPLGLPHRSMKDDVYRGYDIPAGTIVLANIWALSRDPTLFTQPHDFCPERYLNLDEEIADLMDPNMIFGFGRRACPGRWFGDGNIWLVIASTLATFNVEKARDANGKEITPPAAFAGSFVRHPKPFHCAIKPRSLKAADLIHETNASLAA